MIKTLHLIYDGDSYEVEVDIAGNILSIWRYIGNRTSSPQFVQLGHLDEELQDKIQHLAIANI